MPFCGFTVIPAKGILQNDPTKKSPCFPSPTGSIDYSMVGMFWLLIIQSQVQTDGRELHKHQWAGGSISQAEQTNVFSRTQHMWYH